MGNLATGSQEGALNSGTVVRCPQGSGLTLRPPGQRPQYMWIWAGAGPGGTLKGSPPGLQPRMDDDQVHPEPTRYSSP